MNYSAKKPSLEDGAVRIGTVAVIPKILDQMGYEPAAVLEKVGLDLSLFDDPDNVISFALRNQLVQLCATETQCPYFGLLIGQQTGLSSFGLVGFLVQHLPDARTALQSLVSFAHLHVRGALIHLDLQDDLAFLGYSIYQPKIEAIEHIEDGAVAIAFNIMHKLCGPEWHPHEVHFAHGKPADIRPFKKFFKAPLIFNSERNGVLFSAKWLKQPIPGAEPELRRLLQKYVDQLNSQYSDDFVEQVRRVLHSTLLIHQVSLDQIATLFDLHPRTLNRRLKTYGTSFRELADQSRFEIARQLLKHSILEVNQIAAVLYYSDASAFTRSFRRWSGITPALWRKQNA